jgi:hypothetical protein
MTSSELNGWMILAYLILGRLDSLESTAVVVYVCNGIDDPYAAHTPWLGKRMKDVRVSTWVHNRPAEVRQGANVSKISCTCHTYAPICKVARVS